MLLAYKYNKKSGGQIPPLLCYRIILQLFFVF